MAKQPLAHLAGGLFIVGCDATSPQAELKQLIKDYCPAGVIYFKRNIESPQQVAAFSRDIFALYPDDFLPIISVDQEGGRVARFKKPFTEFPPAAVMGRHYEESGSLDLIKRAAAISANELGAVGINLNFAPVLDVNSNPDNPVIGDRSFSRDPHMVAHFGQIMLQEFEKRGVMACGKHFPGHGDTTTDSHEELPVVDRTKDLLRKLELLPFQECINHELSTIMTAHVLYPQIDPDWPATLSKKILYNLLRKEMGFRGLIIADNMEMKAIWGRYQAEEIVQRAVHAGCDLIIGGGGGLDGKDWHSEIQVSLIQALIKSVEQGKVTRQQLESIHKRIQQVKHQVIHPYQPEDLKSIAELIGTAQSWEVAGEFKDYLSK